MLGKVRRAVPGIDEVKRYEIANEESYAQLYVKKLPSETVLAAIYNSTILLCPGSTNRRGSSSDSFRLGFSDARLEGQYY